MGKARAPNYKEIEMYDGQIMYAFFNTEVKPPDEFKCDLHFNINEPYIGEQLSLLTP